MILAKTLMSLILAVGEWFKQHMPGYKKKQKTLAISNKLRHVQIEMDHSFLIIPDEEY